MEAESGEDMHACGGLRNGTILAAVIVGFAWGGVGLVSVIEGKQRLGRICGVSLSTSTETTCEYL
jgi:hypothetical protein